MNERPEHSDSWDRTMFMLRRNQRNLVGLLLLCVVGGIIYYVATKPKEPKSAGAWRSSNSSSGNGSSTGMSDTGLNGNSDLGTGSLSSSTQPRDSNVDKPETLEDFLTTASATDLVEELLRLRSQNTGSLPVNFVTIQRRSKIAKHLSEMEVPEDQKLFAINDYIEAVVQLDAINQTGGLNAEHVRDELIEIRDRFSGHQDDRIGAKSSLVYVLVPIHNFYANKDESELAKASDLFDLHADKIIRHPDTTARLAKLSVDLYVESDYADGHRTFASRLMTRMEKAENFKVKEIARLLREQIYFAKSELGTLVERIEGGNSIARDDVQSLFEGLDTNPTSRLEIYKIATNVIAEYTRLGHLEDAEALTNWLITINQRNAPKENRDTVNQAITQFQELQKNKNQSPTAPAPK